MKTTRYLLSVLSALSVSATTMAAQQHKTSLTISPYHLTLPIVELTAEFRMTPDVGVAGIVGVGSYEGASVWEFGGQCNYYLVGDFDHGMQIGAEIQYMTMSDEGSVFDEQVSWVGRGLALSPMLGYKYAAGFGLTLNVQAGVAFIIANTDVERESDFSSSQGSYERDGTAIMSNLNIGWSF